MNHGKCLPGISRWLCTAALGSVVFLGSDRAAEAKGTEPVKLQRLKASKNSFGTPLKTPDDLQHMLLLKRLDAGGNGRGKDTEEQKAYGSA